MAEDNGGGLGEPALPAVRVEVGMTGSGPGAMVVITEITPQSSHVLQLSPDTADGIADLLHQAATRLRSGLLLPPGA